ncbi:MAG: DNA double-strand break repair protein Rad50, partial [Candidatus Phytoplasma sp. TWB_XP]
MISPLDLIKGYFSFTSYLPWVVMAIAVFSLFVFFKRKFTSDTNATTWKGYLMVFIIILLILSFIYLCFFKPLKESSSKYTGQLIGKIDEAIKKYDETINNYHGLKNDWEKELEKCEKELKDLYKQKEITQEYKDKIKEVLDNNETKIKELKAKLSENAKNIAILKGKLVKLEEEKEAKEKELQQKKEERKLASPDDKKRLQAEIDKLQEERIEIAKQIRQVNLAIN